jgi:magnesium transporter
MLINCVAYQDGKRLAEIEPKDIHRYIAMPDCFVWVAMLERDPATLEQMREEFDLHPLAVEDAQYGHQRPKIEEYGESLFAVLHLLEPDNGSLRVGEVNVFAGPNYVLTIRSHAEKGFRTFARAASGNRSPEVRVRLRAYALIDAVVDRYFPGGLMPSRPNSRRSRTGSSPALRRARTSRVVRLEAEARHLPHAVAPLLEAVNNLLTVRGRRACAPV